MKPFLDRANIPLSGMLYTISMLLSYNEWRKQKNITRLEVINVNLMVEELTWCILAYLPKQVVKSDGIGRFAEAAPALSSPIRKKAQGNNVRMVEKEETPRVRENDLHKKAGSNGWHPLKLT